jgi:hypothetical protein
MTIINHINQNWTNEDGTHNGGVSTGIGYTIAWQRGPLNEGGRNGAFMIEVLQACRHQMNYYQDSRYACQENEAALHHLDLAIAALQSRRDRRDAEGTLGTHEGN